MLKIEIRHPPEGVCPKCRGTGVVLPRDGPKQIVEAGRLCDKCPEGATRWEQILKRLEQENL